MVNPIDAGATVDCALLYSSTESNLQTNAETLAGQLGLPCYAAESVDSPQAELHLLWDETGLSLQQTGKGSPGPVRVDFVAGTMNHRRHHGGGFGEMVAKAVGVKASKPVTVLDCTAGLGRDAFILASLGCEVTLLERTPIVAALLADGLLRGAESAEVAPVIARMQLLQQAAGDYLQRQLAAGATRPDVVYLDPMFPTRKKSALVKKEMRLFHALVGDDADAAELFPLALQLAGKRVVVKRPKQSPLLHPDFKPHHSLTGKANRFDVYMV